MENPKADKILYVIFEQQTEQQTEQQMNNKRTTNEHIIKTEI